MVKGKNANKALGLQTIIIATATHLISSCAGRDAQPVAISQPQDANMACTQIQAEIAGNNQLISEKGAEVAHNVAAGVAGLPIWPIWFAMDFKGAASTDQEALKQCNIYLASMATNERCGSPTTMVAATPQPTAPIPPLATAAVLGPVSLTPAPAAYAARRSPFHPSSCRRRPSRAPIRPRFTLSRTALGTTSPEQSSDFNAMTNSVAKGTMAASNGPN